MVISSKMAISPGQPLNGQRVRRIPRWGAGTENVRRKDEVIRVCTVNIGTLLGKRREVVEMLARRRVDICCIQEVRYKNQGTTAFGSNEEKYKFWYHGNKDGTNGVGILVRQELVERVLNVERYSDRPMKIIMILSKTV